MRTQLDKIRGEKEAEISKLESKLIEKNKELRFQDISNILDNLLKNQRSPSIKYGLGFHETIK